jgi:hypothetical protein
MSTNLKNALKSIKTKLSNANAGSTYVINKKSINFKDCLPFGFAVMRPSARD